MQRGRIHEKIPAFFAASKFSRRKWSSFTYLIGFNFLSKISVLSRDQSFEYYLYLLLKSDFLRYNGLAVHLRCHDGSEWHGIN